MRKRFFCSFLFNTNGKKKQFLLYFLAVFILVAWYNTTQRDDLVLPSRWSEFSLLLPKLEPEISNQNNRNFYLIAVVNSGATGEKHRRLRQAIRQTWGHSKSAAPRHKKWKLFFALGISENPEDHKLNLQEASRWNDILIGDFNDRYINVITKTYMSHYWVSTRFSCKYILKADDDVFVRVPELINWLQKVGSPQPFYGGFIRPRTRVSRGSSSKWFITREQYSEDYWPPFCLGAFHVLSSDVIPKMINYTTLMRPVHTDDAYLAVALKHYGIEPVQIPGFMMVTDRNVFTNLFRKLFSKRPDCELVNSVAIGHKVDPSAMFEYHTFSTKSKAICSAELRLRDRYFHL